jgi:antitoxin component YwqK of YwqJK toxin-antitoxin module
MKKRTVVTRDGVNVIYEDGILDSEMPIGDGIAKWFYEDGTLKAEVPKVGGESHGIYREWYKGGRLAREARYEGGRVIGVARHWNENGSLAHELEDITANAAFAKSNQSGVIRHFFLWNGKPISKTKWLKKLAAAGFPKAELERRFATPDKPPEKDEG